MERTDIEFDGENIDYNKLPKPSGWRILVGSVRVSKKSAGGIILTDSTQDIQKFGRFVAKVLAVGSECYNHEKFQGGVSIKERQPERWAKVGDYVIVGQYAGQSIPVFDENEDVVNLKLLNDDEILATVKEEALSTIVFN